MIRRALAAVPVAALAAALAGCGSHGDTGSQPIRGTTLTIYASVPMHGASRLNAESVINGARLALARVGARVGRYRIAFRPLDDSTVQRQSWDPGQTALNARLAAQDPTAIGYIGEFNSGASAVSIPVLNRAGIPQISPASAAVGLTSAAAGAAPGEPQKYYPTGIRTYLRVVPDDAVQSAVQVKLQQRLGCHRTYVVHDGEVDGEDMADSFALVARSTGLDVVGVQAFQPRALDYTALAAGVAQSGADCVLISAITESGAALVTKQIAAAMPRARIFAAAGVAESTFTDPGLGGIPSDLDRRVLLTTPTLGPDAEPTAGRAFYDAYERRYGPAQPYAIYGYEAMSLLLAAIDQSSGGGKQPVRRSKVLTALFATHDRQSVIGTYSMTPSGDTTIRRYGVYKIVAGQPRYWQAVEG